MEDGPDGLSSAAVLPQPVRNGEVMANFPDVDVSVGNESKSVTSPVKVNGDSNLDQSKSEEESDSSDFNALIIDESIKPEKTKKKSRKPKCGGFKGFKKSDDSNTFLHSNPYFSESIFDLLEKSQGKKEDINQSECVVNDKKINCKNHVKHHTDKKTKSNPKLREYAQYLGLQPTVQFKCSKCSRSGFLSLATLNEHLLNCNESAPVNDSVTSVPSTPTTNIRVTRKVFLCSACGTYYENWNLFLHMREVHKRYICLYCLGMFSHPEKLSFHIITKHNCVPKHINSLEEFYNVHKEPCFLICCQCQKGFTDRDNFFDHKCDENKLNANKSLGQKHLSKQGSKIQKQKSVEHVTADSSSTDVVLENSMATDINLTNTLVDDKVAIESVDVVYENLKEVEESMAINMETGNDEVMQTQESIKSGNSQPNSENIIDESDGQLSKSEESNLITTETQQNSIICDNLVSNCDTKSSEMESRNLNTYDEHISEELEEPEKGDDNILDESDCFERETNISEQEHCQDDLNDSFDISLPDEDVDVLHPNKLDDEELLQIDKENPEFEEVEEETRKVPKVTLKLPKTFEYTDDDDAAIYESDESEKLTMEVDQIENETEANISNESENANQTFNSDSQLQVAGSDVPIIELELEQPLDKFDIRVLLQKCLSATVPSCVYCNHARKISVNGKQLGLHAVAEHRFSAVVNSITAEELIPESFVTRITDSLSELESIFFNLDSSSTAEAITFSHVFECFQCRYSTTVHKELYLHNRKMHAKSILLCIMCKSNFYSYSELICHLCPGLYEIENDVHFKCCMCVSDELPSAFRLMVHLRKRHHACDVCLELCNNQSKLSNHVWKHKLHHLCYRCGIAYRNKPDITKHLFWKHGTESVLCKKCLQKKWPHVYHFCIPPTNFLCEECNLSFSRAVSLVVHKRLHKDDKPHLCTEENCGERFISKKLLLKHEFKHREPPEEAVKIDIEKSQEDEPSEFSSTVDEHVVTENTSKEIVETEEKPKLKVDVYDLPELNLSESDSSDSDDDGQSNVKDGNFIANDSDKNDHLSNETESQHSSKNLLKSEKPTPVLETIWDDFRNYQANKEKLDGYINEPETSGAASETLPSLEVIMKDHDYCEIVHPDDGDEINKKESIDMSVDHDYCYGQNSRIEPKEMADANKTKISKKKLGGTSSSNSSSNSDSSSCTCGSNCSCSSSSASSSSSSDSSESDSSSSEGRRRQQARRARRKQKGKNKKKESESAPVDVVATDNQPVIALDVPIQESDLETSETDTDEDFYDKQPHKLAKKLLAEKKNQLLQMAAIGPYINGSLMDGSRPSTPSLLEEPKLKKKSKSKKRKKKNKSSKYESENPNANIPENYSSVTPLTINVPKHSPVHTSHYNSPNSNILLPSMSQHMGLNENDSSLRASKRRRVPNKFYGYSSDEEQDKIPQPPVYKWRKVDLPTPRSPMVVPPITIKTVQPTPSVEPITVRTSTTSEDVRPNRPFQHFRPPMTKVNRPPVPLPVPEQDSASDSNDSSSEEERPPMKEQPALYCYCRCPYDEVSEMIGCDASDCAIEWFHFECVGIMVPPKGQWFCPDCRKKKQQRRDMLQTQL